MNKFYLSLALITAFSYADMSKDQNKTTHDVKLDEITVEATRTQSDLSKYAGSVGILKSDDLKAKTNVIEAIGDIPGVDIGSDKGREIGRRFYIRGFGSGDDERVIIMQDGVKRSVGLYSNMISTFRTDADILKRVEVVKGASSILHGSGAIGGIVSLKTKDAHDYLLDDENFGAMLGGRIESNHMHSARAAIYGRTPEGTLGNTSMDALIYGKKAWHGKIKLADGGSYSADPKVPYNFNNEMIRTLFFKGGVNFADSHRIELGVFDFNEELDTLWQTLNNNDEDLFVKGKLEQRDLTFNYFYKPLSDLVDLSFRAYKADSKYNRGWEWDESMSKGNKQAVYVNDEDRYGFALKNDSKFQTGFLEHNLVTGVDYDNRQEDALWIREYKDLTPTAGFNSHPNEYNNLGLYFQDIISWQDLELTLGGRYDRYERKVKKNTSTKFTDSRFSPRVALAYTVFDSLTFLGGYSESFRAPTPHETSSEGYVNRMYYYLPNPNLKSETAKEYEVGLSFVKDEIFGDDSLYLKGVYFYGKIKDMISLKAVPELGTPPVEPGDRGLDPSQYGRYENVDDAVRHGFEISANYKIDAFRIGSSYERLKVYDKKTKEDLSHHASKLQLHLGYSPLRNLDIDFHANHYLNPHSNPASYVSRGTTYYYVDKHFTLADVKVTYKMPKGVIGFLSGANISFGVNNIFDKQYINAAGTTTSTNVGRGRNFYLDLEMRF
ncbi:MAG: TonB-dependent receptor [Campylobacter sp.]|nr:TonB-dependent receptor [Campylobacter sp.]